MAIKHKKQSFRADDGDPGDVQPSDWNDDHDVGGVLGQFVDVFPAPDTFPYLRGDGTGTLAPISAPARVALGQATAALVLASLGAAALDSPAFINTPTAPTPGAGNNSTLLATTAYVRGEIAALVASSPSTLDTLNELATALGNDPNFSATVTASLGNRLRFDAAQTLTTGQKAQAVANLGLAAVAVSGNYADLAGKPVIGTAAGNLIALDGTGKLPAVDGSQLTGVISTAVGVHGADVASAATINLEGSTADLVNVTGNTAITAITLNDGHARTVMFTGTLVLTNGASLVLPGGANITTEPGDFAIFRGYPSGVVRCVHYARGARAPFGGKLIGLRVYTSSGTYTRSPGCKSALVEVVAGSGAGGGTPATSASQFAAGGAGGGAGAAFKRVVGPGATETVTVGAGGVPVVGSSGGNGGSSSFGSWVSATGGGGGLAGSANGAIANAGGGGGGTGIGGDLNFPGQGGQDGIYSYPSMIAATVGGMSGRGGRHGGAGSGAINSSAASAGSAGDDGYVLVWEYE